MFHKTRGYHNKFDSTKSLKVCYWYFRTPQCGWMEHRLKGTQFYVQKRIAPRAICYNPPLVCDKLLEAPTFIRRVYLFSLQLWKVGNVIFLIESEFSQGPTIELIWSFLLNAMSVHTIWKFSEKKFYSSVVQKQTMYNYWNIYDIITVRIEYLMNKYISRALCFIHDTGLILDLRPANERLHYFLTMSLIGWAQP